jgi:hypothetical protein
MPSSSPCCLHFFTLEMLPQRLTHWPTGICWCDSHLPLLLLLLLLLLPGFPPASYSLQYPVPGDPQLARQAADLLM